MQENNIEYPDTKADMFNDEDDICDLMLRRVSNFTQAAVTTEDEPVAATILSRLDPYAD